MDAPRADEATQVDAETRIAVRSCRLSRPSVSAFLSDAERPRIAWVTDDVAIVGRGAAATITADGPDRFGAVQARAELLFDRCEPGDEHSGEAITGDDVPEVARPRLFGGFAFTDRSEADASTWAGFPGAWFVLPTVQLVGTEDGWWLTVAVGGSDASARADRALAEWRDRVGTLESTSRFEPPGVVALERTPVREGWRGQVVNALERVERGELQKVVLAQSVAATLGAPLDVPAALERLGETYPDCFKFVLEPPDSGTFFGATPERLIARRGRTVTTEALAGSTGRGDTPAEDEWLADDLLGSEKDRHEHDLVVEAIRNQLEPLASSVRTGQLTVRRLATVQHLLTPMSAELHTDDHVLSLVEALHPTPTVGGLPPERALETIAATETFDRGWYAGPVGWFDAAGDGDFAVAIRSALTDSRRATCFAGAGIVADSDPDREWDEVQLKYRPMLDVLE